MNRQMRRASDSNGRKIQKGHWNAFEDCTLEAIEKHRLLSPGVPYKVDQVFKNNKYIVQCFHDRSVLGRMATKCMIRRSDSAKVMAWLDLQRIKNEIFGESSTAIQIFPPQGELVDDFNIYWLWVLS